MTKAWRGTGVCLKTAALGGSWSAIRLKSAVLGHGAWLKLLTIAAADRISETVSGSKGLGAQTAAVVSNTKKVKILMRPPGKLLQNFFRPRLQHFLNLGHELIG